MATLSTLTPDSAIWRASLVSGLSNDVRARSPEGWIAAVDYGPAERRWEEEVALGRLLLDDDSVQWIDDFSSSVAEQLDRQVAGDFRVEVLHSGFMFAIWKGPRWVVEHVGEMLTSEWRPVPGSRFERAETTLLAILNHVAMLARDDQSPGEDPAAYLDGLRTSIAGNTVQGRLDWEPFDLHVEVTVDVPPEAVRPV